MVAKAKNPKLEWGRGSQCFIDPDNGDRVPVEEAITWGPNMINVPGAMGPVPMVVVVPLGPDCLPGGKTHSGLVEAPSGLIKP